MGSTDIFTFKCLRFDDWVYFSPIPNNGLSKQLLCLISAEYNPDKYEMICTIFSKRYQNSQNPVELVKLYLMLFTRGTVAVQENGKIMEYNFSKHNSQTNIKGKYGQVNSKLLGDYQFDPHLMYRVITCKKNNAAIYTAALF